MRHSQKGFSLVELAIVLVIIGLIVGGILTGQDLIHSSELNSVYSDVNKYKTAVNTFRIKYNALPGDIKNAGSFWGTEGSCPGAVGSSVAGTCNGDGNGQIDWVSWNTTSTNEHYRAWEHLTLAGLVPGSYNGVPATGTTATSIVPGTTVPEHALKGYVALMYTAGTAFFGRAGNVLATYGTTASAVGFTPPDAASIDSKYDDGAPGTGEIMTFTATQNPGCATTDVASTAAYMLSSTSATCLPVFLLPR